jgi:hypothetical protein
MPASFINCPIHYRSITCSHVRIESSQMPAMLVSHSISSIVNRPAVSKALPFIQPVAWSVLGSKHVDVYETYHCNTADQKQTRRRDAETCCSTGAGWHVRLRRGSASALGLTVLVLSADWCCRGGRTCALGLAIDVLGASWCSSAGCYSSWRWGIRTI